MTDPKEEKWQCMDCLLVFRGGGKKHQTGLYMCPHCGGLNVMRIGLVRKEEPVQETPKLGKRLLKG